MAERRMFAKSIVFSDDFLDLPLSARCLYFTLGMVADDDGFIDNARAVMRQCGCAKNDLDVLIAKQYVLTFGDGVIVIKHWRLHNYLRSDRYHMTKYTEHKAELVSGERGYERLPVGIPTVDGTDTEDRLGKDSIGLGKDSVSYLEEITTTSTSEEENAEQVVGSEEKNPCPFQKIMELYHLHCPSYPKLRAISGNRRKAVSARWREYPDLQTFRDLFIKAEASSFLKGNNDRNWTADFDWLMKPSNMPKVLEGKYDNKVSAQQPKSGSVLDMLKQMHEEADQ